MVDCEMCGMKGAGSKKAQIEGTVMSVCVACATYGVEVSMPKKVSAKIIRNYAPREFKDPDEHARIVHNYGSIVKSAREKRGLKQEQVAKKLNEKESLIHNIESGKFKPRLKTARKLEKFFGVSLVENSPLDTEDIDIPQATNEGEPLTMGDLLKRSLEKK